MGDQESAATPKDAKAEADEKARAAQEERHRRVMAFHAARRAHADVLRAREAEEDAALADVREKHRPALEAAAKAIDAAKTDLAALEAPEGGKT